MIKLIKQPTRITSSSETLIDLSITSDKNKIIKAGVFDTCIADHRLNYVIMKLSRARTPPKIKLVYDWKESNIDDFKNEIALAPWHSCNAFDNIDDNYWMFETLYNDIKQENLKQRKAKV